MLKAIGYTDCIARLRRFGWTGPRPGGNHPYMSQGKRKLTIPNPHGHDIPVPLLRRLLRQAGIDEETWTSLD
jgi:predicted RNA binding protein YcfA (HicA-like mRNA interferase family)